VGAKGTHKDWMSLLEADVESEAASQRAAEDDANSVGEITVEDEAARGLAEQSLDFLAGLAMPTVFKYMFPPVLLTAWSLLVQLLNLPGKNFSQVALGIPRGHGKTTLIKLLILFIILFTRKKFILVIGSTAQHAENIISDVVDMLNEFNIIRLFTDWKIGIEKDTQNIKKFGYRNRNIILAAIGAEGTLRGLNLKNERPDVMVFEDIQTKECSISKQQSDALENWMIATAMKAKSPHGCLTIFCGNMFPGPNSILKKLKSNKNWIKFVSGAILADGSVLWPELRSLEDLLAELDNDISMGHPEHFFSEVLNDTEVAINTSYDLSNLSDWKWGDLDLAQGRAIIIDPATGKLGGDLVAIGYMEVYDGKPGLREVIEERLSPKAAILKALLMAMKYDVRAICCESQAYQSTFLFWFAEECKRMGIEEGFIFLEVPSTTSSKNSRIGNSIKSLQAGDVVLHPDVRAKVLHQVANWQPMKRDNVDNVLDLLGMITKVLELYELEIMTVETAHFIDGESYNVDDNNHAF
jgi:hypothetical protein